MIPHQCFSIWIGPKIPDSIKALTDEAAEMHARSGWKYTLYRDEVLDIYASDPYVRRLNGMSESTAFIVDRIRLLLLRDQGGFWADSDCKFLKSMSALNRICDDDKVDFVTGIRNPWRPHVQLHRGIAMVDNTVMGSAKGGRMVNRLLGRYTSDSPKQTGHLAGIEVLRTADESTVLLNYKYFYTEDTDIGPETILLHDVGNLGSWTKPPVIFPMPVRVST